MKKRLLLLIPMLMLIAVMVLPISAMAAMTVYEYFDADSDEVTFTVEQDENDIAGFAVGVDSYWDPYVYGNNIYGETWEAFNAFRSSETSWETSWRRAIPWLEGWGEDYDRAFVYASYGLAEWYDYLNGGSEIPEDDLTILDDPTTDYWRGYVMMPHSPFRAVTVNSPDTPVSTGFLDGETIHVVPIPGALVLLGTGLLGLVTLRRRFR